MPEIIVFIASHLQIKDQISLCLSSKSMYKSLESRSLAWYVLRENKYKIICSPENNLSKSFKILFNEGIDVSWMYKELSQMRLSSGLFQSEYIDSCYIHMMEMGKTRESLRLFKLISDSLLEDAWEREDIEFCEHQVLIRRSELVGKCKETNGLKFSKYDGLIKLDVLGFSIVIYQCTLMYSIIENSSESLLKSLMDCIDLGSIFYGNPGSLIDARCYCQFLVHLERNHKKCKCIDILQTVECSCRPSHRF